jgi:hypothetical protein
MIRELAYDFTYLDLICTDCAVFSEVTSNYLLEAARDEYSLFTKDARTDRVKVRLERVDEFIKYLEKEEKWERNEYRLDMKDINMFSYLARTNFDAERMRVLNSANRQKAIREARKS